MLIKKLSKIGITLFLAASFFITSPFDARADFTTTDSQNLATMKNTTNTISTTVSNIYSRLNTTNSYINNIYNHIVNTTDEILDDIRTTLDTLDTRIRTTIHSDLDTINSNIITIGNHIVNIDTNSTTNGTTLTNIYNLLNTYTNTYLASIDKTLAVISDNIAIDRWGQTQSTITVTSPASNTYTYTLAKVTFPVVTVGTNQAGVPQLNITTVDRYGNFHGIIRVLSNEFVQSLIIKGVNAILGLQYIISTDTEYIGTELHLAYQLLDSFKSANHTDIINFASQNHTDITNFAAANHTDITTFNTAFNTWAAKWVPWAKQYYVIKDNLVNTRRSETVQTIELTTFEGPATISYELTGSEIYNIYYDQEYHRIRRETLTRYANFRGAILNNFMSVNSGIWAICQYLNDNSVADSIANNVSALNTNLTNYSAAEQQIQNRVQNALSTFIPDTTLFSGFVAIAWCSQYLQKVYVALGSYGTVIMIGLLLGVCMQFIGYFRYKY